MLGIWEPGSSEHLRCWPRSVIMAIVLQLHSKGGRIMSGTICFALLAVALAQVQDPASELLPPVRLEAAGKPIDTDVGHAAPFVCDIDGDGKLDLLVGQF